MKVNGVILRKIEVIEETLRELRNLDDLSTETLDRDFFLKKGVERAIQVCVEAVIDIAHRIVSLEGKPPCTTSGKALEAIASLGVIVSAETYRPMVQFRNVVVHRYEIIDDEILVQIVKQHLDDFDEFIAEVRSYAKNQS